MTMDTDEIPIECLLEQTVLYDPSGKSYTDNDHKGEFIADYRISVWLIFKYVY